MIVVVNSYGNSKCVQNQFVQNFECSTIIIVIRILLLLLLLIIIGNAINWHTFVGCSYWSAGRLITFCASKGLPAPFMGNQHVFACRSLHRSSSSRSCILGARTNRHFISWELRVAAARTILKNCSCNYSFTFYARKPLLHCTRQHVSEYLNRCAHFSPSRNYRFHFFFNDATAAVRSAWFSM